MEFKEYNNTYNYIEIFEQKIKFIVKRNVNFVICFYFITNRFKAIFRMKFRILRIDF